jgi:hypothetical protein
MFLSHGGGPRNISPVIIRSSIFLRKLIRFSPNAHPLVSAPIFALAPAGAAPPRHHPDAIPAHPCHDQPRPRPTLAGLAGAGLTSRSSSIVSLSPPLPRARVIELRGCAILRASVRIGLWFFSLSSMAKASFSSLLI